MNDPVAAEPDRVRVAESAPAPPPPGFGYALAQARVRAGLSVEQLAGRVRLHPKQLRAIENEELHLLPAPAYINGFVRNCARELGLDAGPLIEDLNSKVKLRGLGPLAPDLGAGGPLPLPVLDDRAWRHLVLAGIVAALVCALGIGVWMARPASDRDRTGHQVPGPAGAARLPPSDRAGAPAAPAPEGAPGAGAAPQGASPGTPESPGGATPASPVRAPAATSAAEASGRSAAAALLASAASAADAAARVDAVGGPLIPVATVAPAAGATTGLVLRFNERSWVQVSQPDGHVLLSRSGEPGSMELVNSPAPLVLVIGRADAVQVEYRGQPVNLKPYVNNNGVARVLLADGRAATGGQTR
ncbi:MAG TPA: RodZ domain-containing protein [Burkholderiaceae bacterium]|nr:RodZ domain-containing protein [Burkholderiaceae bacterium]